MRVLLACEWSGTTAWEFQQRGHEVVSVDLEHDRHADRPGRHHRGDVFEVLDNWGDFFSGPVDLMIAHPPCTDLAVSGAGHFAAKIADGRQQSALELVRRLLLADVPHIALENPVSVISSRLRKPDQIIQPWQFGHGEQKQTCLWLKNLPLLTPTDIVPGREQRIHNMSPSADRGHLRSISYPGIAAAMAVQWGQRYPVQVPLW